MINFLLAYGADMKKHIQFREGKKFFNNDHYSLIDQSQKEVEK